MLRISLIVCTRGRPLLLERLLHGIAQLRYRPFELIVIHDPSDTVTAQYIAAHAAGAKIGFCAPANLAAARNIGLAMAAAEIAAFIDDDAVPEPDWLDQLAICYAQPEVTAAGGFIRAQNGIAFQSRRVVIDPFGADHHRAHPIALPAGWFQGLTGTNFSVRRASALAIGGFDENYPYFLEETDFLHRLDAAGGKICVATQAEVHHGYAAGGMRGPGGAPKSLHLIARSKAYFCRINRRPETTHSDIDRALARFVAAKAWLITSHLLMGRLRLRDAVRLYKEVRTGIGDAEALETSGRRLAVFDGTAAPAFKPFQQQPRQRLCVLLETAPENYPQWPQIRALASDYEVTLLYFGASVFPQVSFADGIWQHRLSAAWPLVSLGSRGIAAELRRIASHRNFEKVQVASADRALLKAATASALQPFQPEGDLHPPDLPK